MSNSEKIIDLKGKKKEIITIILGLCIVIGRVVIPNSIEINFWVALLELVLEIIICGSILYINRKEVKKILGKFKDDKISKFILKSIGVGVLLIASTPLITMLVSFVYVCFFNGTPPLNILLIKIGNEFSRFSFIIPLISQVLVCPISEELVFRYTVRKLVPNNVLFVLISAILFAFIHDFFYCSIGIVVYFLIGIIYALFYLKIKDIRYMIGGHSFNNFVAGVINLLKLFS